MIIRSRVTPKNESREAHSGIEITAEAYLIAIGAASEGRTTPEKESYLA